MTNADTTEMSIPPKLPSISHVKAWVSKAVCKETVRNAAALQGLMAADSALKTLKYNEDDRLVHKAIIQDGGVLPLPDWWVNGGGDLADFRGYLSTHDSQKDTPPRISIIDLLGTYNPDKRKITLHREIIRRAAAELRIDRDTMVTLVLIHESAHAAFHIGRDFDGTPITDDIWQKIPSWLHETVAQYITYLAVKDTQELFTAFTALCGIQREEYLLWEPLARLDLTTEELKAALITVRRQGTQVCFGRFKQHVVNVVCAIRGVTREVLASAATVRDSEGEPTAYFYHTILSTKWDDVIAFFRFLGGKPLRQRGSHQQWSVNGRTVAVPVRHNLGMLTLKILRDAGTCRSEYMKHVKGMPG